MPYRKGFSTLGCPDASLEEALALAEKHGMAVMELRALGGTLDLAAHFTTVYGTPATLARRLQSSSVPIAMIDTSLRLTGCTDGDRRDFLELARWAEALGIPWLRVFDGHAGATAAGAREAVATLDWWRDIRRKNGWAVDCAVETHDSLLAAAAIAEFLSVAPRAHIVWDAHHTWKRGGEELRVTYRALRDHVVHIHVKDSSSAPGAHHARPFVLPGTGEFPMRALQQALEPAFAGPVSLEWELFWHPCLPSLDEALRSARAQNWW